MIFSLHFLIFVFHEGLVHQPVPTWGGVVPRKVPVALMLRTGSMQPLYGLEDELHGCLHSRRTEHLRHLAVDFFYGKRLVDGTDAISLLCCRFLEFSLTRNTQNSSSRAMSMP